MSFIDNQAQLDQQIFSLRLELTTVIAEDSDSDDTLYVNIVFSNGTRLYEHTNHEIKKDIPSPGETEWSYTLPVPENLDLKLDDIAELYLRKDGDDGWFVGSVLLFANDIPIPLIGNRHVNQFIDSDDDVLRLNDWSTSSFCVAQWTKPKSPLLPSGYRLLGPVIGPISDHTAVVLYRVDREGTYHFQAVDHSNGAIVYDQIMPLEPFGIFKLVGLQRNRRYDFDLKFVRSNHEDTVPGAAGSLTTYTRDGDRRDMFTFAFGSCVNPEWQESQGSWTAIRALARTTRSGMSKVRLMIHLGDTFYFYDQMTREPVENIESMHAAHISARRQIEFLNMSSEVPCCGVWDDHDFAGDDEDSTAIPDLRDDAVRTWRQYWGNQPLNPERDNLGLTSRISYGSVDIYLLDGRYYRNFNKGICFGNEIISRVLAEIDDRARASNGDASIPRVVVLATGSNWTHNYNGDDPENYGASQYNLERENFFAELGERMGSKINGLFLLSGDNHVNEIFHVKLSEGKMAPEFSSSPFTRNSELEDKGRPIERERVWGSPTKGPKGKRGFATLSIQPLLESTDNWKATVRYFQEAFALPYAEFTYVTKNGQFIPTF
jgi:PhoD-like phosphatase